MRNLYDEVLFIGPGYKNHRGGIGAVLEEYSIQIVPFHFLSSYNYKNKFGLVLHFISFLFKYVKLLCTNKRIKIVHIHTSSYGSFFRKSIVVLIGRVFRKKTIMHIHGSEFQVFYKRAGLLRFYIRGILRLNDLVICLSPQWFSFFSTFISSKRLRILNNPVSIQLQTTFKRMEACGAVRFLFLGKIGHRKGIFDVLKAVAQLPVEIRSQIKFMIGGNGEVEKLDSVVKQYGLSDAIHYVGWVNGDRKNALLVNTDVYVLTSYNEGLPVSILEAMSYGLPIISTPIGGIPEIVKDGQNGFLVTPGDIDQISNALSRFISAPELIQTMGNLSKEFVKPFLSENVFPELYSLYATLLSSTKNQ